MYLVLHKKSSLILQQNAKKKKKMYKDENTVKSNLLLTFCIIFDSLSSQNMGEKRTEYCFHAQRKRYYCLPSHYVTLRF